MHLADSLISPGVAGGAALVSIAALAFAARKVRRSDDRSIVPLMGVAGAFVFAAQMINFSIPGTGSSGHIIGGVLLAAMLGPWAALLTLASVLTVQCLLFADGGLMALGCNILNMGICTTLIAYPLIYRPMAGQCRPGFWRQMAAAIAACVVGLEIGAVAVTCETELSGITALGWGEFLTLMTGIHLFIGIGEGVATGLVLWYVASADPSMLVAGRQASGAPSARVRMSRKAVWTLVGLTVVLAASFFIIASGNPDGLEWSIEQITGSTEVAVSNAPQTHAAFASAQEHTALLPDYESNWSGIAGCTIVVILVWAVAALLGKRRTACSKA